MLYIGNKLAVHGKNPTAIDELSVKLEAVGYTVITAASQQNKLLRLLAMVGATVKNRRGAERVLIDTYSTQNFYYAVSIAALCRFFNLPYIPILHGGNLPDRLIKSKRLSHSLFGKAYANVAPSKYMLHHFQKAGFHNLSYIPNTLEIADYPFKRRESITPKLLWVRSFSEIYNPLFALEIVAILKNKGHDVSLCMIGPDKDGTLETCKRKAAQLDLPITFTGKLPKKEWILRSKEYDIFINTTDFDNMPISVMEAMALGLPVVSTHVGGMPFLIENGTDGSLVPPDDAEAFAEVLEALIANPLKAQTMAKNARAKMENLDWEKVKHKWIKLLGE